jgi:6-pyruvoyl-tetrahydropterin synthase
MRIELIQKFELEASHALGGYETPHPHLWGLTVAITGTPIEGKLVDMVVFRESIQMILSSLNKTYLNENQTVTEAVRTFPTCETLSQYFLTEIENLLYRQFTQWNPTLKVASVSVSIHSMEREELGRVRLVC